LFICCILVTRLLLIQVLFLITNKLKQQNLVFLNWVIRCTNQTNKLNFFFKWPKSTVNKFTRFFWPTFLDNKESYNIYIYVYTHKIYIHIYMCVFVCLCLCFNVILISSETPTKWTLFLQFQQQCIYTYALFVTFYENWKIKLFLTIQITKHIFHIYLIQIL
jgi:hypothetical protein